MKKTSRDEAFAEIEHSMYLTLETYSNVHRGAGFKSLMTTAIYERARTCILDLAGVDRDRFELVFCHPGTATELERILGKAEAMKLSSAELGLPLGVETIIVERAKLATLRAPLVGGGTADMVSPRSTVWSKPPARFEAGTPGVVNIAAFAAAMSIARSEGNNVFLEGGSSPFTPEEILLEDDVGIAGASERLEAFRRSLIGRHFPVPVEGGRAAYLNFDSAASTSAPRSVWESAKKALRQPAEGRGEIVRAVSRELAQFLGAPCDDYEILFTANTTGAINLAARALTPVLGESGDAIILNTWYEHNSNELPWRLIPGTRLRKIPLGTNGLVDLDEFERTMRRCGRVALVAFSGASNVTGEIADIEAICRIAHERGAMTLVDGAQLIAHRGFDMKKTGVDFLAFSGHKVYAPFGSGALIAKRSGMAEGLAAIAEIKAAGEENLVGIAALGKTVRLLGRIGMETIRSEELRLRGRMARGFASRPGIKLAAIDPSLELSSARQGGVLVFQISGAPHNLASKMLADLGGIGTRSGCFCAHLFVKRLLGIRPARAAFAEILLRAFPAFTKPLLPGLVRVSIGAENDDADLSSLFKSIDRVLDAGLPWIARALSRIGNGAPAKLSAPANRRIETAIEERITSIFPRR